MNKIPNDLVANVIIIGGIVCWLISVGAIGFIAVHFVAKFW